MNDILSVIEPAPVAVPTMLERYRAHLAAEVAANQISEATGATYAQGIRKFLAWSADHPEKWDRHAIRAWLIDLKQQKYKPSTIAAWFAGVRAFFSWLVSIGEINTNPTDGLKRSRRTATRTHAKETLSEEEALNLLDSVKNIRDRALLYLLAYTGARGCELLRANIEDISSCDDGILIYVQGKGKTDKNEIVLIANPEARQVFYEYLATMPSSGPLFCSASNRTSGARLSASAMRAIVRGALNRAGITSKRKTTHSLRHTAISNAVKNGASLEDVQRMARHASATTTEIYIHHQDRLTNAAEKRIRYRKEK